MQKKLIAAAVAGLLAAPVFAQSTVTISGSFKAGYEDYKLTGTASSSAERRVSDQDSRIFFLGTEDLGGGLKAWFQLESRFATDLGAATNGWSNGNTAFGLMGGFGKLTIGRWDIHYHEFGAIESSRTGSRQTSAGQGLMSQVNGTNITTNSRTNNLLKYDSPNVGGFSGTLAWSANPRANEGENTAANPDASKDGAWSAAGRYAAGPLVAGLSYYRENREGQTDVGDQRGIRAYAGYTMPMGLKVGLGWDRSENRFTAGASMTKRNAWFVPVTYSFGPSAVYLTYARARNLSGPGVTDDTGANQWTLGYDYALSKRTSLGVFYTKLDNKENATYTLKSGSGSRLTAAGNDARQLYLGITHSF